MTNEPYHDANTLRKHYHDEDMTQAEIADKYGVSAATISDWMDRHNIETDHNGGGWSGPRHDDERLYSGPFLREWYVTRGKTSREIAEELGCGKKAVLRQLEEHGIGKRSNRKRADDERAYDGEYLRTQYADKQKSSRQIASELGCSKDTILRQLDAHGIERRDTATATKLATDPGHPIFYTNQKGYELTSATDVRDKQPVGIHRLVAVANGADPQELFTGSKSGGLQVHHKNRIPWDNRPENLELLSKSDHQKEHMSDFTRQENGRISGVSRE